MSEQSVACTADVLAFIRMGEEFAKRHGRMFWTGVTAMASDKAGLIEDWRPRQQQQVQQSRPQRNQRPRYQPKQRPVWRPKKEPPLSVPKGILPTRRAGGENSP